MFCIFNVQCLTYMHISCPKRKKNVDSHEAVHAYNKIQKRITTQESS